MRILRLVDIRLKTSNGDYSSIRRYVSGRETTGCKPNIDVKLEIGDVDFGTGREYENIVTWDTWLGNKIQELWLCT